MKGFALAPRGSIDSVRFFAPVARKAEPLKLGRFVRVDEVELGDVHPGQLSKALIDFDPKVVPFNEQASINRRPCSSRRRPAMLLDSLEALITCRMSKFARICIRSCSVTLALTCKRSCPP